MNTIRSVSDMQQWACATREAGRRIAFVPTMGFLHEGHLALMREGKGRGDYLVVSIFVNPTQFGAGEDYQDYPRDLEGDTEKVSSVGGDIIFAPSAKEMYPSGYQTFVAVEKVTQNLCGASRPAHFQGVTTVVAKLFNIVKPQVAIFGEKDYQQLVTIRQMTRDLNFDIEIIGMPTIREEDGLAMSSRNKYLSSEERKQALCLFNALNQVEKLFQGGEKNPKKLIDRAAEIIRVQPAADIDYVKVCHPETIEDLERIDDKALMALAVKIGKTRLIDNRVLKN
ncbi:MAG: pantoate--beta-alanine ligase [Thermodesulfobacteriota bacterium]|jgi:pantoate--beta-alanine ligase|nr:MAG: pantoate--beta-alanine ligase [Thermodesulfobacteriota bacterium]